jgi:excisionase family DNA binding protein
VSLALHLDDGDLEQLADLVAEHIAVRLDARATQASPWLRLEEAGAYVGLPAEQLRKLVQARRVPHYRPGRRIMFRRDELDAWMAEHRVETHRLRGIA